MFKVAFSAALLAASAPAIAQYQPAQPQQPTSAAAKPKPDNQRVICKVQSDIGSRLATTRVCMTAEQWKQQQQDARNEVERGQREGPQ